MKSYKFINLKLAVGSMFFLFLIALAWTGCKDDTPNPCDNVVCQNGGSCVDGNCNCPEGFSGNFCEEVDFPYDAGKYVSQMSDFGDGIVQSWVEVDGDGNPIAIGLTMNEEALTNLGGRKEVSSQMPEQAANTLFEHVVLSWSSTGHQPAPEYRPPHFDFRFYMISEDERSGIQINDFETSPVPPRILPADYANFDGGNGNGFSVFFVGVSWSDSMAPEWNGGEFTHSFVYGSHMTNIVFMGPHITEAYLLTNPNATVDIKQPQEVRRPGYYPTKYSIRYDADKQEYEVALENFVKRD